MIRPDTFDADLMERFRNNLLEASGAFLFVDSVDGAAESMSRFLKSNSITKVAIAASLPDEIVEVISRDVEVLVDFSRQKYTKDESKQLCSRAEAGITGADAVLADTGTIVMLSRRSGDRLCSLVPPLHMVWIGDAPVFPDWQSCFDAMKFEGTTVFITGPSRTADIEKQLVLGAHGPKRVAVWGTGKDLAS